jgi:hypothetical protein
MPDNNMKAAVVAARVKKERIEDPNTGRLLGYKTFKKEETLPSGKTLYKESETEWLQKRKQGIIASGKKRGGRSNVSKGPSTESKSGDECFANSKNCGPNR